jgi:hypothetical protein
MSLGIAVARETGYFFGIPKKSPIFGEKKCWKLLFNFSLETETESQIHQNL